MTRKNITDLFTGTDLSSPEAIVARPCAILGIGTLVATLGAAVIISNSVLSTDCPNIPTHSFGRTSNGLGYKSPTFQEHINHHYCVDSLAAERAGGIMPTRTAYEAGSKILNGHFVRSRELSTVLAAGRAGDTTTVRAFDGTNMYELGTPSTNFRAVNEASMSPSFSLDAALRADSIANPMYR